MPEDTSNDMRIVLIARKSPVADRVAEILRHGGMSIATSSTPDTINPAIGLVEVVVVVANYGDSRQRALLDKVRARFPDSRIVLCSSPVEPPTLRGPVEGIDGLVWNTRLERSLEPTVRAVVAGQMAWPVEVLRRIGPPELTNREKQVLSMVVMGLTNMEIAQKLFVSENTVKSHLNTAYRKLGVHSRAEAHRRITDPDHGLGSGILAITPAGLSRGRPPKEKGR